MGLGCNDYKLAVGEPALEVSAELIDFGEVVVGNQETIGITVKNNGDGPLTISSAALDGTTSPDFAFMDLASTTVDRGEETELKVRYVPDVVGQDFGRVQIASNDPDVPITTVDLSGFGVEPNIDVDPDLLWFGEVAPGDSKPLVLTISARGTGTLKLTDIQLPDTLAGAYSWSLPVGVGLPYELPSGVSVDLIVTFSPPDAAEWSGDLVLQTNDPTAREATVQLLGNSLDDPTGNAAPVVSISDPNWGESFLTTDAVTVRGVVYDEEDAPTSLVCIAYASSSPVGTGSPDADGNIFLATIGLPAGDINLSLRCLDTEGAMGSDSVDVTVWDPKVPISYVLSGGGTPFDWWSVDDDVSIYLDGELVYADTNHTQDNLPPVTLDASVGQTVRVVVTDYNYCDTSLDALELHFGTTSHQSALSGFCYSACPTHECFDPDYAGPWPGVVYDQSFTISIP